MTAMCKANCQNWMLTLYLLRTHTKCTVLTECDLAHTRSVVKNYGQIYNEKLPIIHSDVCDVICASLYICTVHIYRYKKWIHLRRV